MIKWSPIQKQTICLLVLTFLVVFPYFAHSENINVSVTVFIAECADGLDNDGDLLVDYPNDPDCDNLGDDSEETPPPPSGDDDDDDDQSWSGRGTRSDSEDMAMTEVIFNGKGMPGASVSLLQDGVAVRTFKSNTDGTFQFGLEEIDAGTYTFSLMARDVLGNTTAPITFTTKVPAGSVVYANNIIFPPTLSVSRNIFNPGEGLGYTGYSLPNKTVNLYLDSALNRQVNTSAAGLYSGLISLAGIPDGKHNLKSAVINGNAESPFSKISFFDIGLVPQTTVFSLLSGSDLNKDGRVGLVDLSILVYWYRRSGVPQQVDLNRDNMVDLSDVSILLYNWTG